jgi:hypothetical protein
MLAGSVAVSAWLLTPLQGTQRSVDVFLTLAFSAAVLVAYHFPIHLRVSSKIYMTGIVFFLMAVLLPLPLAVTAAFISTLAAETSARVKTGVVGAIVLVRGWQRAAWRDREWDNRDMGHEGSKAPLVRASPSAACMVQCVKYMPSSCKHSYQTKFFPCRSSTDNEVSNRCEHKNDKPACPGVKPGASGSDETTPGPQAPVGTPLSYVHSFRGQQGAYTAKNLPAQNLALRAPHPNVPETALSAEQSHDVWGVNGRRDYDANSRVAAGWYESRVPAHGHRLSASNEIGYRGLLLLASVLPFNEAGHLRPALAPVRTGGNDESERVSTRHERTRLSAG